MGPIRTTWRAAVALATIAVLLPLAARAAPAGAASCTDPFTPEFRAAVASRHPGQRVTASVHDTRTGCWYDLEPGMAIQTASVIKAQFLAGVLLRAQEQGRPLSAWERERITPMMSFSHNPPASDLFVSLGGIAGQERLDERFGLTATSSTNRWGATVSTARDRTRLALQLLHGGGPLDPSRRAEAWQFMTAVHPTQTWGITAGVPAGWTVALKNGFYPTSGTPRWRIGSSGFVRHDASGQGYAISVMTDRNADHASGQALVEMVAAQVSATLTDGPPASRPVDRSRCVATAAGESWSQVAARLGTADHLAVRHVSGGPANPLGGMRACRPDLYPPYDPNGAHAHYVRGLYQTFLGRPAAEHETEHHATRLDRGASSRFAVALALARSTEWVDRYLDGIYRAALDRPADPGGLAHWRARVAGGTSITDVGVAIFASDEFFQRSGGTADGFATELYRRLLRREPDAGGLAHWVERLDRGVSRGDVVRSFYDSPESRDDRVRRLYRDVLGRDADPAGVAHWSPALLTFDDVVVGAVLATSAEYFTAVQPR